MPKNKVGKPGRLYFKSYLQAIRNSVGANTWRNFYVSTPGKGESDALDDGDKSCALFVSSILLMFKKAEAVHATVQSTVEDMRRSGWKEVSQPQPGDVLVWEPTTDDEPTDHIGFYMGDGRAISNSSSKRTPQEHDMNYDEKQREIVQVWRMETWDEPQAS